MTFRTNPELAALLAAAGNQYNQVRVLNTALTAAKRVKCKKASTSTAQVDVWATGVLFRDAALLGTFAFQGKDIVGYGKTSDLTTSLAASLTTEKCVMRIEGGGHWAEFSMGLAGSGADSIFPEHFTATNSIAISGAFRIRPSANLPDGTPDTTAPTASVSAPSNVVNAGPVNLTATVADGTGVVKVEFVRDGGVIGTRTSAPWTYSDTVDANDNGNVVYSVKAYDAAGNVGTSSSVTTSVNIEPPTETGPATAVGAELTDLKVELDGVATAQANMPITIGQTFAVGALPAAGAAVDLYRGTTTVPCQIDVKATHPDGSVRHGILTAVIPSVATGAPQVWSIRRATASAGTPPVPADFAGLDALVTIVDTGIDVAGPNAGTTYTAQLAPQLTAAQYETWLTGKVCADWRVVAPLKTAGGALHPDLVVIFDVRGYKGQARAKIDFIIENGRVKKNPSGGRTWDPSAGTNHRIYRVSLSVAGATVFTRAVKGYWLAPLQNRDASNNLVELWPDRATGLANNATVYTASMLVDGNITRNLSITGSAAQNYGQLRDLINTQLNGAAIIGLDVGRQSLYFETATVGGSIKASDVGTLFPALDFVPGYRPIHGGEVIHYAHRGWKKTFWWGGEPKVHVRHNRTYLENSRGVPKYQEDLTGSQATINTWVTEMANGGDGIMANGISSPYMAGTGYAPGIGVLPAWAAMWVVNQGPEIKKLMLQMGDRYGSWEMVYRDVDTNQPISFETYPMATTSPNEGDSINPATGLIERFPYTAAAPIVGSGNVADVSHHPDFCYAAYLATGDRFYLDGLLMQQRWLTIVQNPGYREGKKGLVQSEQPRGQAWMLRTTIHAAYICPNDYPHKAELTNQVAHNAAWYNTAYVSSSGAYHNNLGVVYHGYGLAYGGGRGGSPWMDGFLTAAAARGVECGFSNLVPFLRFKTKWVVGLLTSPPPVCWQWFGQYVFLWKDAGGPIYSNFTEVWNATFENDLETRNAACGTTAMQAAIAKYEGGRPNALNTTAGYPDLIGGYGINAQGAVAAAATYDVPGGKNAWLVYASNTLKPNFNEGPQFAIVPRA